MGYDQWLVNALDAYYAEEPELDDGPAFDWEAAAAVADAEEQRWIAARAEED
jgi:hypothetical protein